MTSSAFTTGLPGLDRALKGLLPGDNIVWQVDSIDDYRALVTPFWEAGLRAGRKVVYFRFASHETIVPPTPGVERHEFRPEDGFETFLLRIHKVIESSGRGALYIFDCLSELAGDWSSDQMLGNFFMLTCPYLFDMETIANFALFRDHHSTHATSPILNTTQLFIEVYRHERQVYVRPVKVQHRYSSTMYLLHVWQGEEFKPVTSSMVISEIMTSMKWSGLHADRRPGVWERAFQEAQEMLGLIRHGQCPTETVAGLFRRLARMVMTRDEGMLRLVSQHLTLEDLLEIRKRMIGTGLVGGKTVGMLVARTILKRSEPRFRELLEEHDSFFVGSDVFYTYLVRNGVWWTRQKQRDPRAFLDGAEESRRRILTGEFPRYILQQFEEMLDYFGQSPFIVRSSSLLEDNFGNSFAGKYESVFCANQGPRERRLEDFLAAVRAIYASAMSERALRYRANRGLLDRDEQMALLVMRVSGAMHGRNYFPHVAGVGFSFNPYAWNPDIDPRAGVVRLVFGLGTRAVDRSDDDYTRLVALNAPDKRPEANFDEVRQYAQRKVDYLDLEANQLVSGHFLDLSHQPVDFPIELIASPDRVTRPDGTRETHWVLTFDRLLKQTGFVRDLRAMLGTLDAAYKYPVDVEFTANFDEKGAYRFNLVQCRPLQVQGGETPDLPQVEAPPEARIIEAHGAVIGRSRFTRIERFIYVVPRLYGALPIRDRHDIARLIGDINRALQPPEKETTMILGPGRWGTSSPELGIPVAFGEVNRVSIICEIVAMREGLIPDCSLGTHFLNELVEMDILYLAIFPEQRANFLRHDFFESAPNRLLDLTPEAGKWKDVVRVISPADALGAGQSVAIRADALRQEVVCYSQPAG
jgi:hypothetical protein